ncbi:MAG: twin-arginine translocase TatA/TatE family subunit [Sulfuricurvum sp.]|jgi:sec-independent protein translocase protein TatA|uniref:Sec-independent protein translocase subunit TatA/TatB n=1 Tax=Sulfuricurvum sp. TaxID=2025608 RepID=UPI00261E03BA|nr:twin-arginine translocase TatA/TatE family subunit [Sulfuricurvum sp.]MDD2838339.1 twin-arginine translocase TatA/TatE family subunit [Sulfuricurvum sp.]MDD3598354.1 twin-arginine translocase TatA/TatE family subunit [Sulfuricurvum sp.]MDD4883455.1 twin-arginine translocase TatA/TatE family subunit [Sulfuricurvum sp.]
MAMPSGSELLLVFGIVVLLFGSKKIPELAKGLGQGIRNFKNEMKEGEPPPGEAPKAIDKPSVATASPVPENSVKA